MLKKILVAAVVGVGLIYGSGHDFASIKQAMLGLASENARDMTGAADDGWGPGNGY